jgi:hypothetical protein
MTSVLLLIVYKDNYAVSLVEQEPLTFPEYPRLSMVLVGFVLFDL